MTCRLTVPETRRDPPEPNMKTPNKSFYRTGDSGLTFVTIVFSGDLPLLRLQARSMAMFVRPEEVSSILLVLNDVNEEAVSRSINGMLAEYGPLQDKVRIVPGDEVLLPGRRAGRRRRLWEILYVENRFRLPFVGKGGWRGGNGYRLQQALKLASARAATSDRMLILDGKNLFLRPLKNNELFDGQGRALAVFEKLSADYHRGWLSESMEALAVPDDLREVAETTGYSTPYPVSRQLLLDVLEEVESRHGPVQALFASKRRPSEFMLIFCYCQKHHGGTDRAFGRYDGRHAGIWADFDDARINAVLDAAENDTPLTFGLHRAALGGLSGGQRKRLLDLFDASGIDVRSLLPGVTD